MSVKQGEIVIYSLFVGDEERPDRQVFTSIGHVVKATPTHVTVRVAEGTKFPLTPAQLPAVHRSDTFDIKSDLVQTIKVPQLYIRKTLSKDALFNAGVLKGLLVNHGGHFFTLLSSKGEDFVFKSVGFDFRGTNYYDKPAVLAVSDKPIDHYTEFNESDFYAKPLDPTDPVEAHVLKSQPHAILLSGPDPNFCVAADCVNWKLEDYQAYIYAQLKADLVMLGCEKFTEIKVVKRSEQGYYAFTTANNYIDTRGFQGTVYIDPETGVPGLAKSADDENGKFFKGPYLKAGYKFFTGRDIWISETKCVSALYNMVLPLNNLVTLMREGLDTELFQKSKKRAIALMVTEDYPHTYIQDFAKFYLDPLNTFIESSTTFRRRYLWWLNK